MLSRQAIDLLKARRALHEVFVFPSPMDGHHIAQKAISLAQYEARKETEGKPRADLIELPWTVHDVRRMVATGLTKLGCPRVVQDRILNHVEGSVSAIYDRHRYDGEARVWLQKWADYLEVLSANKVVSPRAA